MRFAQLAERPLPERQRLSVRVVDAEDLHASRDPELEDAPELVPERRPVLRLEVERIDVLVFLRRVLRVFVRSVGTVGEPRRMLAHVRMVRRGLERDVERDLEPARARGPDEPLEVAKRAEAWLDRFVAAFRGPNRPRAPGLARL